MHSGTEAVRQEYDRLAPVYDDRWRSYVKATLKAVTGSLSLQGCERVLDIACGTGELETLLLARWPSLRMIGTDISLGMLRQASAKSTDVQVKWVQAEAAHLPFPDGLFDYAICANSFHYFRSPRAALERIRRVLRPQGRLIFTDWCDDYLSCKLCSAWLRWTDPAFCQTYTRSACRSLLEEAGFRVLSSRHFRVDWIWGMMLFDCAPAAVAEDRDLDR